MSDDSESCLGVLANEGSVGAMETVEIEEEKFQNHPHKRIKIIEEEDRISKLPDLLLLRILLHLPNNTNLVERAILTLTLSKRWLSFWIDFYNLLYQNPTSSFWPSDFSGFRYVAKTLIQCSRSNLTKFHLEGFYNILFESHLDDWIRYAVNCNVEHLNLTLRYKLGFKDEYVLEEFFHINSCFTHVKLQGCVLNPTGVISWKKLKSLCLSLTKLDEDLIENILSGCPVLETLELRNCYGYECLNITSKRVKNLLFSGYTDFESFSYDAIIEINAPNISSLIICGHLALGKLLLLNVSSLVKADLDYNHLNLPKMKQEMLKELILNLHHVNELKIGISCSEVFSRLEATGFNFPSNLKVLDSPEVANLSDWPNSDLDTIKRGDWKCFEMRERNESSVAGRITVKLLQKPIKVEDRISALPDGLLIEILSRLPETKYAIRTSTLSKRWIHLWTYVSTLIFKPGYGIDSFYNFFPYVDKTLSQCRQLKLYKFELHSWLAYGIQFESLVNKCIRYAITCNVEELNLDLQSESPEAEFVLDQFIFINSCITDLRLSRCILNPTGAVTWNNLKSLCISYGILDEDLIENILSGSPLLETFELCYCSGYSRLDISSKSVKNLVFSGYTHPIEEFDNFVNIEVNAPYILSLTIHDEFSVPNLLLLNVSSLVKADLDYWNDNSEDTTHEEILEELILNLQHVKELKIGISCFKSFFGLEAKGVSFPSNVKILYSLEDVPDWYESDIDCDGDGDGDSDSDGGSDQVVDGDWKLMRLTK